MGKLRGEATGELRDLTTGDSELRDGAATSGLKGAIKVRAGKRKGGKKIIITELH